MQELRLGDSLELLVDHRGKTPQKLGSDFTRDGVPVASAIMVDGGRLNLSQARYVDESTSRRWMAHPLKKGDAILTSEAPLGRVARVPNDYPLVLGQRLFGLRGKRGILHTGYLFYALQSPLMQGRLLSRATGTTVMGIRQSALRDLAIPAPAYGEQEAIAELLGSLDDKIAANSRLGAAVDDLLSAKLEVMLLSGRATSVALGEVAAVNAASVRKSSGPLRYIDIASVGVGKLDPPLAIDWAGAPSRARRVVTRGDTLWSTVRPNRRSHTLNLSDDPLLVASTGLAVLAPRAVGFAYLYEVTRRPEFSAYLETVAEGSAYPAVRADRFEQAPFPLLPQPERDRFELLAAPMRERSHAATAESATLAELRDTLLPGLMSNRLRIPDAEKQVGDVV